MDHTRRNEIWAGHIAKDIKGRTIVDVSGPLFAAAMREKLGYKSDEKLCQTIEPGIILTLDDGSKLLVNLDHVGLSSAPDQPEFVEPLKN